MKAIKYILYWIGQCTWGCIMTTIGLITVLVLCILGYKPHTFGPNIWVCIPGNWGGINLGPVFIRGGREDDTPQTSYHYGYHTPLHESGHGLQNLVFGPLFPFLVGIPSPWRCVLRDLKDASKMKFLTILVSSIAVILGLSAAAAGMGYSILALVIIGLALAIYACAFCLGFILREIPKYETNSFVPYDDVWFEHQATAWGVKTYHNLFNK